MKTFNILTNAERTWKSVFRKTESEICMTHCSNRDKILLHIDAVNNVVNNAGKKKKNLYVILQHIKIQLLLNALPKTRKLFYVWRILFNYYYFFALGIICSTVSIIGSNWKFPQIKNGNVLLLWKTKFNEKIFICVNTFDWFGVPFMACQPL